MFSVVASVLEVTELRTEFRVRTGRVVAVDGVSLSVEQGESVGIVGESGCGKTTTGLSVMRLLPGNGRIASGRILLSGRDLATLGEREMRGVRGNEVALIPQNPMTSLNPTRTIGRQIVEAVRLHRDVTRAQARQRALEVLTLVEMPRPAERVNQYAHELSGGLRQRVMIAMALACEPKLLIADEPTTALDVTIQAQILDLIDSLRERLKMAVILITHDMGVIAGRTDKVIVMYAGKVVEKAKTETLFTQMRHPYADALLASVPKIGPNRADRLLSIPGLPPDLSQVHANCRFNPRCFYATDQCRDQEPALTSASYPGTPSAQAHEFACFHPVNVEHRPLAVQTGGRDEGAEARRAAELDAQPEMLGLERLVKEFPVMKGGVFRRKVGTVKAVSDVSFSIRTGEAFGLVGESGCGKTTIGWLAVALQRADSGKIRIEGQEMQALKGSELRRLRANVQLMFQDPYSSLNPRLRVGAIVGEPLRVHGRGSRAEQRARVYELLDPCSAHGLGSLEVESLNT
jgi:peptide/nickel transport system ATP-binding protein